MQLQTKTRVNTKIAVALVAGAVILAAAAATGVSMKKSYGGLFKTTPGYGPGGRSSLEVSFVSQRGYNKVSPGDTNVALGEFRFEALGGDVLVTDFNPSVLVQDTSATSTFQQGVNGGLKGSSHFNSCVLKDFATGIVIMGPVQATSIYMNIPFTDDFTIAKGNWMDLQVSCDFSSEAANGPSDFLATDILSVNDITALSVSLPSPVPGGPVSVTLNSQNGNPPSTYVVLQ